MEIITQVNIQSNDQIPQSITQLNIPQSVNNNTKQKVQQDHTKVNQQQVVNNNKQQVVDQTPIKQRNKQVGSQTPAKQRNMGKGSGIDSNRTEHLSEFELSDTDMSMRKIDNNDNDDQKMISQRTDNTDPTDGSVADTDDDDDDVLQQSGKVTPMGPGPSNVTRPSNLSIMHNNDAVLEKNKDNGNNNTSKYTIK